MADTDAPAPSKWGRAADYLLGRNTLIGIASLMLLVISGFATWHGMRDFIIGVSTSPAAQQQELPGGLAFSNDLLVIVVVVALTFLMWLALRETFGARRSLMERMVTFPLYVFLAIWSIGFGYGFWWSLIAGEEATRTGLAGLQEDARDAAGAIAARLDAVKIQLDNVVTWSESQMAREETSGGSCGVPSGAGRGPLYNARKSVRDQIASLRDGVQNSWLGPVQTDLERLQQSVAQLEGSTVAERQQSFEGMAREIRGRARSIAARSNELGQSTAAEMRAIAAAVSAEPGSSNFSCYDPTLAQRLTQAAEQANVPANLKLREAVFNEGPAGVANAIKNLWSNIGSYLGSLGSYLVSGGSVPQKHTTGGEPITGRDLIALLATIGVDLGLLALAILNPPGAPSRMPRGEERRQIQSAVYTAINRTGGNMEWVRRHFIYHRGVSYLVIPNLYSCDASNEDECRKALAMNQLAGVLDDMDLVRWPKRNWYYFGRNELDRLKAEEKLGSDTDLTDIRKEWLKELERRGIDKDLLKDETLEKAMPLRNHGLFSKAERALTIAGWSDKARRDIEIFRLVDVEGLTPILMVLNEDGGSDVDRTEGSPAPA